MPYSNKDNQCTCVECGINFLSFKKTTRFCSVTCNNLNLYKSRDVSAYNERKRASSCPDQRRNRYKNDQNFRLACILRARLKASIKNKTGSAVKDLGCSIEELKKHLESRFVAGMTWENHGRFGWHIDHIRSLASFNLADPDQLKQACHYTNLQPLWWRENIIKGDQ